MDRERRGARSTPAYRSNVESIYAVGDCSDHAGSGLDPRSFDLTPVAIAEGRAIAETLFNANPHVVNYDHPDRRVRHRPRPPRSG